MKNYLALVNAICTQGLVCDTQAERYLQDQTLTFNLSQGDFPLIPNGSFHLKETVEGLHAFLNTKKDTTPHPLLCTGLDNLSLAEMMDALVASGKGKEALEALEPFRLHTGEELSNVTSEEEMRRVFQTHYALVPAKNALYQMLCKHGLLAPVPGSGVLDRVNAIIDQLKKTPATHASFVVAWAATDPVDEEDNHPINHTLFQFHTQELSLGERLDLASGAIRMRVHTMLQTDNDLEVQHAVRLLNENAVPRFKLNCEVNRRFTDVFDDLPLDLARYALLINVMAQLANMAPGEFVWSTSFAYLGEQDMGEVDAMMSRQAEPMSALWLNAAIGDVASLTLEDVDLFVA